MYKTKITSQGTISIPVTLRQKYGLKAGETVTITDTGTINIVKNNDFQELRQRNAKYIIKAPFVHTGGDGLTAYVTEKYGEK